MRPQITHPQESSLLALAEKLPDHIAVTIDAIAQLHSSHHRSASRLHRILERLTARAGRPMFIVGLIVLVTVWIALNTSLVLVGRVPFDEPPFFWMQGVISLTGLLIAVAILTTQRREDQLAAQREQLTLQLAILSDQKAAKIIELLEHLRRDHPDIVDRLDAEAVAMSVPVDPNVILKAIADTEDSGAPIFDEPETSPEPLSDKQ